LRSKGGNLDAILDAILGEVRAAMVA